MKKRESKIGIRITFFLIVLSAIYLSFKLLSNFLWTAEYFNIKTIIVNDKNIDLSHLLGKNIFSINLNGEAQKILFTYPNYNKISVVRYLPNCIKVGLKKREAIAYIRLYRYFAVDSEAVLFNLDNNEPMNPNLPVISGLETKIFAPKSGKEYYGIKELALSLDLIKEIKAIRGLKEYRIKKIDASTAARLSFYILENIEIKTGESDISHKLRLLNSILTQLGSDLNRIKYIDLRFKEPVIKYKNEK